MVYMEGTRTGQLVPRHIFIDFQDNFGNWRGCFLGNEGKPDKAEIVNEYQGIWSLDDTHQQQSIPLGKFQQELLEIDEMSQWQYEYE